MIASEKAKIKRKYDSLFKSLYLAMMDIIAKRKGKPREWSKTMEQFFIYIEDRISTKDLY